MYPLQGRLAAPRLAAADGRRAARGMGAPLNHSLRESASLASNMLKL